MLITNKKFNTDTSHFMLSDNQILSALVLALVTSLLAIRLGSALYQ
jgi:photosystem I reaction center subunit XII